MTTGVAFICAACVHFRSWIESGGDRATCTAFPGGIPDTILYGFDHRQPHDGDGGIRFTLDPDNPLAPAHLASYERLTHPPTESPTS